MAEPGRGGKGKGKRRGDAGGGGFDDRDGGGGFRPPQRSQQPAQKGGYAPESSGWKPDLQNSKVGGMSGRADQDGSWRDTRSNGHIGLQSSEDKGGRGKGAKGPDFQRNGADPGVGQNSAWRNDGGGGGYASRDADKGGSWRNGVGEKGSYGGPRPGMSEPAGAGGKDSGPWRGRSALDGGKGPQQDTDRNYGGAGGKGYQQEVDRSAFDRKGPPAGKGSRQDAGREQGGWKGAAGGKGFQDDTDRGYGDRKGAPVGKGYRDDTEREQGGWKGGKGGRDYQEDMDRGFADRKGKAGGKGEDFDRGFGDRKGKAGGKNAGDDFDRKGKAGGKGPQQEKGGGFGKGSYDDADNFRGDGKGRPGGKNRQEDVDRSPPDAKGKGARRKGGGGFGDDDEAEAAAGASGRRGRRGKGGGGDDEAEEQSAPKGGKGGKGGKNDGGGMADEPPSRRGKGQGGPSAQQHRQEPASEPAGRSGGTGAVTSKHLSTMKFSSLKISQQTKNALAKGFGYELMTEVQAATIEPMLAGKDITARAKTGTGKTLAFLVPMVERIYHNPGGVGGAISALVLSPTRELAAQISTEGKVLLEYHAKLGIACFFGGTNMSGDQRALAKQPIDILVATPGRMQDHLDNTQGFRKRLEYLQLLVLDEADQLLDMGFRDAILKILRALPPPGSRQGALFSATFPTAVGEISKLALRPDHSLLNTVKADDEVTPDQIDQCASVTNLEGMTELLWAAVNFEMKRLSKDYKIMVFFTTARLTQLYSSLFIQAGVEVLEIHSRKSQAHRTKATDNFRSSQKGIIFSSDVCARGLDYPNVTAVIQVGIPSSRDQYIHRLGRTGRAGKSGRCILLLHDFEKFFLNQLKDLPVKQVTLSSAFPGTRAAPDALWKPQDPKSAGQAYQAWLGYYNSVKGLGWPKDKLVSEAYRFAESIGAVGYDGQPPPILKKTVGMMGLKGVPGLNIVSQLPYNE